MGEGGRGGKGAKSGQARSACPRVKTRRDGREPVLAVTWRPFPGSYRARRFGCGGCFPGSNGRMAVKRREAFRGGTRRGG